jgi:hypothetical protein
MTPLGHFPEKFAPRMTAKDEKIKGKDDGRGKNRTHVFKMAAGNADNLTFTRNVVKINSDLRLFGTSFSGDDSCFLLFCVCEARSSYVFPRVGRVTQCGYKLMFSIEPKAAIFMTNGGVPFT